MIATWLVCVYVKCGNKRKYIIAYMAFISATLLKLLLNVEL